MRPHLVYGMPTCSPSIGADINYRRRFQGLATMLVSGCRYTRYTKWDCFCGYGSLCEFFHLPLSPRLNLLCLNTHLHTTLTNPYPPSLRVLIINIFLCVLSIWLFKACCGPLFTFVNHYYEQAKFDSQNKDYHLNFSGSFDH